MNDIPQPKLENNAVFWIETEKILPNPYQPRREFDEVALHELADSIRQYGILQPLVVSRREIDNDDGGFSTQYELIAGERRLRASRIAGLRQVPVLIRVGDDNKTKLELAIIENLQREDLNPVDKAKAFAQLQNEFGFKHAEIAKKMGKSREYVANSVRLLGLPQEIQDALSKGRISEGHTRPLLMLTDRPEEQMTLFREMQIRKMTVREAENLARKVAQDKVRKKQYIKDPNLLEIESDLAQNLGTRVHIEKRDVGGVIAIDFFSFDDLSTIVEMIKNKNADQKVQSISEKFENAVTAMNFPEVKSAESIMPATAESTSMTVGIESSEIPLETLASSEEMLDDRSEEEIKIDNDSDDDDLYNLKNFTI